MRKKSLINVVSFALIMLLFFQIVPFHINAAGSSDLRGVWEGTYTGIKSGKQVERSLRLDIDYASNGRVEGIAMIDDGSNGRYFFEGAYAEDGTICIYGTEWIDNPAGFIFSIFIGTCNSSGSHISGKIDENENGKIDENDSRSFALQKVASGIDFAEICGVWEGRYTGYKGGVLIERSLRLEIDYACRGKLEGIASIDGGVNGRYFLEGTYDETGHIQFKGSKWIYNPSNFAFADFTGVYNGAENCISGSVDGERERAFSISKASDQYTGARIDLDSVPRAWEGEYDGHSNSNVVRRDYEIHIHSIRADGTMLGYAIIAPSPKADDSDGANGSYYFYGKINARYGKITLQGYEWIEFPVDHDSFKFVALEGYFDFSSGSMIHGASEDGIWEMTVIDYSAIMTSSGFTPGRDNNSFVHTSNPKWDGAGFAGIKKYTIDEDYLQKLTSNPGEKSAIETEMQKDDWNGCCYGIAMTMGLLYEGYIDIADLTNDKGKKTYYSLPYPKDDSKFLNLITYFQLSQDLRLGGKLDAAVSVAYNYGFLSGLVNLVHSYDSLPVFLKKMVTYCSNGHVELLGYSTDHSGHAVLITGCRFDEASDSYQVEIYDENCISSPTDVGEFYYMSVAKDYSSFSLKDAFGNTEVDNTTYSMIYFLDWRSLSSIIAPVSPQYSDHTRIRFPNGGGQSFRIETESGQYLEYDGNVLSGDLPVYGIDTEDHGEDSYFIVETADFSVLTITETSECIDIEAYNYDDFMSLSGTDIDSAVLHLGQSVSIHGSDYQFEAFISTDQADADENGLISITASAAGDVELTVVGTTVCVASDKDLASVSTGSYRGTKASRKYYTKTGRVFVIDESAVIEGAVEATAPSFDDVVPNAYYADAVKWAVSQGITNGTGSTTFSPDMNVTRAQAVTFLWRAMGRPAPAITANPFTDVPGDSGYYEAVLWAVEHGITKGTSDTAFSPDGNVTRGQMITFLYRTMGEPSKTGAGHWYSDAETWANQAGLLKDTAVAYTTNGDCPRSDVILYLWKALA